MDIKDSLAFKDKLLEFLNTHKIVVLSVEVVGILILTLLLLLGINNIKNTVTEPGPIIYDDTEKLENIVIKTNKSEIEMISNRNNQQADVIFDSIGIKLSDIFAYAAAIDPRQSYSNAIIIVRPKEDTLEKIEDEIELYIVKKQAHFMYDDKLKDSREAKIANNALTCTYNGYVILAMTDDSSHTMNDILKQLQDGEVNIDNINTTNDLNLDLGGN